MRNGFARALTVVCATAALTSGADGQQWNSPRALELARRAVARRATQISANTLASYSAKANGYLTMLAQLGDTAILPPKLVQQTQIAVNVYWHAPASSKQVVVGMRDTLLLPGDIGYYTDRYGIVQSNFPDQIRLGDGRDIANVLHPLAAAGLLAYDFAIVDSLRITTATESINVFQLAYRPKDPSQPRAIGSAFLDVANADIVQLNIGFTRAAILDDRDEHVSVVLENARESGVWLPHRQFAEVQRSIPQLRIGIRGIIRVRWDVCCYDLQFAAPPQLFRGAPISFVPPDELRGYKFEGNILDQLPPGASVVRQDDIQAAQRQVEDLVGVAFRERTQRAALAAPHISDIVRVNRVEGFAIGIGGALHPLAAVDFDARARYGFSDKQWKGEAGIAMNFGHGRTLRFFGLRDYLDARDVPEVSGIRNSFAAQEFGSDYTDPYDVRATGAQWTLGKWARTRWRIDAAYEKHGQLEIHAAPENGEYEPPIPARSVKGTRVSLHADGASLTLGGGTLRANTELRVVDYDAKAFRASVDAEYSRTFAGGQLVTRTVGAALSGGTLAPQLDVYFGGPVTAPGYRFDEFASQRGISQRVEWRADVPFLTMSLGRFGQVPSHATLAPYVHAVWVDQSAYIAGINTPPEPTPPSLVRSDRQGWYPAVGLGFEPVFGVLRFDVARGLRGGRWTFSVDAARLFWPVL